MKVYELIEWLKGVEDQDATVQVLHCERSSNLYCQGGNTSVVDFNPGEHSEYGDFRSNKFAEGKPWANDHTLLLGLDEN